MTIQLKFNKSEENYIDKEIETVGSSLQGTLRNEVSIMKPDILFEMAASVFSANASGITPNYLYIQELGRYYFIRDVISIKSNLTMVRCEEDVLYTHKGFIDGIEGITERSEEYANKYIPDGNYSLNSYPEVQILQFEADSDETDKGTLSETSTILVLGGPA